mmetsp:Transcript_8640/g.21255  ORF Transcript_8640/g.21255 Transcript_8640/m.21255 type:complete len:223 (+) Transcript_8640:894-1562(+)
MSLTSLSKVVHKAIQRSFGSISIPGGGFTTGRYVCSSGSFPYEFSDATEVVATLSSSIDKSETRKKEQHRPMIRDLAEEVVLGITVGSSPSKQSRVPDNSMFLGDVKKLPTPVAERALGLGTKETTLPSRPNEPVPNEDMNELVLTLSEFAAEGEREDEERRFEGDAAGSPSFLSFLLLLDFFLNLLLPRLFSPTELRGAIFDRNAKPIVYYVSKRTLRKQC